MKDTPTNAYKSCDTHDQIGQSAGDCLRNAHRRARLGQDNKIILQSVGRASNCPSLNISGGGARFTIRAHHHPWTPSHAIGHLPSRTKQLPKDIRARHDLLILRGTLVCACEPCATFACSHETTTQAAPHPLSLVPN